MCVGGGLGLVTYNITGVISTYGDVHKRTLTVKGIFRTLACLERYNFTQMPFRGHLIGNFIH